MKRYLEIIDTLMGDYRFQRSRLADNGKIGQRSVFYDVTGSGASSRVFVNNADINQITLEFYTGAFEQNHCVGNVETFAGIIPDVCKVFVDVRWTPDQTIEEVERDIRNIACKVENNREGISAETVYIPMPRPAMEIDADNELVRSIISNSKETLGKECRVKGEKYWGDSGLLYGISKIPTIMYGPGDIGCAHADIEWVETEQLAKAAEVYAMTAIDICGVEEE